MKTYIESASAAGLEWVKSSYSGVNNNCVEVAVPSGGGRAVRDSKNPSGPALLFGADEWQTFVRGAADGDFH
ncbi:DUF397 domain-containing protein [Streptomyces sp. NPDC059863]|uniref:DUF397 domain-containing protein n=1 Tax=unclassified Streptomyces TaxID=2593676 RepID=UPI0036462E38